MGTQCPSAQGALSLTRLPTECSVRNIFWLENKMQKLYGYKRKCMSRQKGQRRTSKTKYLPALRKGCKKKTLSFPVVPRNSYRWGAAFAVQCQ